MIAKLGEFLAAEKSTANSASRRDIDDHEGTPIGQGRTVAILAAKLEITGADQLVAATGESVLQQGLFAKNATYPAMVRVSHTNANGMDLMRIALKVLPDDNQCFKDNDNRSICQANFH